MWKWWVLFTNPDVEENGTQFGPVPHAQVNAFRIKYVERLNLSRLVTSKILWITVNSLFHTTLSLQRPNEKNNADWEEEEEGGTSTALPHDAVNAVGLGPRILSTYMSTLFPAK